MLDMRLIGTAFDYPDETALRLLWEEGTFYLDANVLLNLYRFKRVTSNAILAAFEKLSGRLVVPFQAALEYESNRLDVIGEQIARYGSVQTVTERGLSAFKKQIEDLVPEDRHATIDYRSMFKKLDAAVAKFSKDLEGARDRHKPNLEEDPIRERLHALLEGSITEVPSEEWIQQSDKEASTRFKEGIPPGYEDEAKTGLHCYRGLRFQRRFGDYYLWRQIKEHVQATGVARVALVSDDRKQDWQRQVKVGGPRTVGPRIELLQELVEAQATTFHVYQSDRFLEYAKANLGVRLRGAEVEDVTTTISRRMDVSLGQEIAVTAVTLWLAPTGTIDRVISIDAPYDFRLIEDSGVTAVCVKNVRTRARGQVYPVLDHFRPVAEKLLSAGLADMVHLVLVSQDYRSMQEITRGVDIARSRFDIPLTFKITVGRVIGQQNGFEFQAYYTVQPK